MSQFIQTKEDGTKFVYISSRSFVEQRLVIKETPTQIVTELSRFNKKTGYEVTSYHYKNRLLTAEEYKNRFNYEVTVKINRNLRELEEAENKLAELKAINERLQKELLV